MWQVEGEGECMLVGIPACLRPGMLAVLVDGGTKDGTLAATRSVVLNALQWMQLGLTPYLVRWCTNAP